MDHVIDIPERMLRPDYNFSARDFADPECPKCNGSGQYDRSRVGQPFDFRLCPCADAGQHQYHIEVMLRNAFTTQQRAMTFFTWKTGGEPENELALKVARRFVDNWDTAVNESWIMGFYGDMNTGKTHLAVAIAQAITKRHGISPMFVNVPELLERQRESFGRKNDDGPSPLRRAQEADFLVLDDIGAEYNRGWDEGAVTWAEDFLYKVLDYRINNNKPTLYTTNLKKSQMQTNLGRGASRIERKQVVPPMEIIGVEGVGQISDASRNLLLG